MKKLNLIFMALMLTIAGVQAKTVRLSLRLNDSNLNTSYWNTSSVDTETGTVTCTAEGNNSSIAWTYNPGLDVSSYSKLVFKIKEAQAVDMELRLNDTNGGFWDGGKYSTKLTAGETSVEIELNGLKKADGTDVNLSAIKAVEIFHSSGGGCKYAIEELYFEKEIAADWTDAPFNVETLALVQRDGDYAAATWNADDWTIIFNGFGQNIGWTYTEAQDWSAYKYFVMVPQQAFVDAENITTHFYITANGTEADLVDYQVWNPEASSKDLTTIENGVSMIQNAYFRFIFDWISETKTFPLSAVYLSNTAPQKTHTRPSAAAGTWGTICLPYAAAIMNAKVYDVVGVNSIEQPQTLYLEQVHGVLLPGKAYVFCTTGTNDVTAYRVSMDEEASPVAGHLTGSFTDNTPVPVGSYILVGTKWKKVVEETPKTISANRAYLTLDNSLVVDETEAAARGYARFDISGGVTGIENVKGTVKAEDDVIYNLNGVRVTNPSKGVYVKNGKKLIIK